MNDEIIDQLLEFIEKARKNTAKVIEYKGKLFQVERIDE